MISGDSIHETDEVLARRREQAQQGGKLIQDHIVTPIQECLDGMCTQDGFVQQSVAMPAEHDGATVETQKHLGSIVGGLQFEITPPLPSRIFSIRVSYAQSEAGQYVFTSITLDVIAEYDIATLKRLFTRETGIDERV